MPSSTLIADAKWGIFSVWKITTMFLGNCFWKITTPEGETMEDKREDFYN